MATIEPITAEAAIAILLQCGASVEYKHWTIYKQPAAGGQYIILNMNLKAQEMLEQEETFGEDLMNDAIKKFVQRAGL